MKNTVLAVLGMVVLVLISSCRNDFEFEQSTGSLEFSQDTIYLDTVFSTIGSSTRTFKVYNRSSEDIIIPRIALTQGDASNYRLSVDGVPGKVFQNVELLAQDSMYVFVETTVDILDFSGDTQFLYEDTIEFDSGSNLQKVELVTLIKDAVFLFPALDADGRVSVIPIGPPDEDGNQPAVEGFVLDNSQLRFTNDKPYVIYGFMFVPNDQIMVVDPGARLHFHNNSGIIVTNEASIQVNGELSVTEELENEVIFESDRLDPVYSDVAGQWSTIWLTAGSKDNRFNYTTIKNASVAILADSSNPASTGATLEINNSQIYNSSNSGIIATTADIVANNSVIGNSGQSSLVARLGGSYVFNNCTITNYWNNSFRQEPVLFLSNTIPNSGLSEPLTEATFRNCIIYGDRDLEIALLDDENSTFNFKFENSLLRFNDRFDDLADIPAYDLTNSLLYSNVIFNEDPEFENFRANLFNIDDTSGANGIANPGTDTDSDIRGIIRPATLPDAGAYESEDLSGS
jgi:hypothetical protein